MRVMILCGGRGTRLREYTESRPKPMVEVGGRPILWHIMKTYAHHGLNDFILCLGYKGHVIKDFFLRYEAMTHDITLDMSGASPFEIHRDGGRTEDWRITLADTGEETMTGARLKRAARYLDDSDTTFAATYGDGVSDVDVSALLAFHRSHGKLATLTGVRPPSRFGELELDGRRVTAFSEKPQVGQGLINGGYFIFERGFLDYLDADAGCYLEREPLARCAADGELMVHEHDGYWSCMDTYRDWERLEHEWQAGTAPWRVWE